MLPYPPVPRLPTEEDAIWRQASFPQLPGESYTVTDNPTLSYNCIGWSLCSRLLGWRWLPDRLEDEPAAQQIAWFDELYANYGWRPSATCDSEDGLRKIALYCDDSGTPTHAAKQIRIDVWESKCGADRRITHRGTHALEGPIYGRVYKCYEKPLPDMLRDAGTLVEKIQHRIRAGEKGDLHQALADAQAQIRDLEEALAQEGSR